MFFEKFYKFIPEKKILFLMAIIFFIVPAIILIKYFSAPQEMAYAFSTDELVQMATSNSYKWNFENPYGSVEGKVFSNPVLGSVYLQVFIGFLSYFLFTNVYIIQTAVYYIFFIFFMILLYHFMGIFSNSKDEQNASFIFNAIVVGGIGGLLYVLLSFYPIIDSSTASHLLDGGGGLLGNLIYHLISLVAGYLSLLFFIRKKVLFSSVFLGLAFLIYPLFGLAFTAALFFLSIDQKRIKDFPKLIPGIIIFSLPWIYAYIQQGFYYAQYLKKADYINSAAFVIFGIFLLPPALYSIYKFWKNGFKDQYSIFLTLWFISMVILTIMPSGILPLQPQRLIHLVWVPVSILAARGYFQFFSKKTVNKVITIVVVLSAPTLILWFSMSVSSQGPYLEQGYVDAMSFIKNLDAGVLLVNPEAGLRVPFLAEKQSLRSGIDPFESPEMVSDYESFYSDEEKRLSILEKYKIMYVFYGPQEKMLGNLTADPFLEKIYDSGNVAIYKKV